jgi:cytochrome P450
MTPSIKELAILHQNLLADPVFDVKWTPYYSDQIPGGWNITRYRDVQAVLADHNSFSSEYIPKAVDNVFTRNLNVTDPPKHGQLRAFARLVFSPAMIAKSEDWIRKQCEELLKPWVEKGEMDFVNDFALQLPHRVVSKIVGVSQHDAEQVRKWIIAVAGDPHEIGLEVFGRSMMEMEVFFGELVKERTAAPQDDFISHLLTTEINGERLDTRDVIAMCVAVFLGGYETTKSSLSNAMYVFSELPMVQEHLAQHPEDISKAVSEALRLVTPVWGFPRIATNDVVVSGVTIPKGDLLNVMISTANRDETVFPEPSKFDLNRGNLNQSMSFGHGIHHCLGLPLARVETRIAFEVLFQNIEKIKLLDINSIELDKSNLIYSIKHLYLNFQPRTV